MTNSSGQGGLPGTGGPSFSLGEATVVKRTVVQVGTDANTNANTAADQIELDSVIFDEIGTTIASDEFTLPAGNYEVTIQLNLDANGARTNFYIDLRDGTTVLDTAYGPFYARNATNHDDTGGNLVFNLETSGGSYNFATRREAGGGDVNLDGGKVFIKRYEQVSVVTM